ARLKVEFEKWGKVGRDAKLRIEKPSFRPSQRARPQVAGPMSGSARAGIHSHDRVDEDSDNANSPLPVVMDSGLAPSARPGMTGRGPCASPISAKHRSR